MVTGISNGKQAFVLQMQLTSFYFLQGECFNLTFEATICVQVLIEVAVSPPSAVSF
jgi:hypothetical protein